MDGSISVATKHAISRSLGGVIRLSLISTDPYRQADYFRLVQHRNVLYVEVTTITLVINDTAVESVKSLKGVCQSSAPEGAGFKGMVMHSWGHFRL